MTGIKTLKDIQDILFLSKAGIEKFWNEKNQSLKYPEPIVAISVLRAEAIKWVQACDSTWCKGSFAFKNRLACPACNRFIGFFSLCEEDLK